MLRQPGASATRVLSQSGAESREEGKGPPQVSDLFRGPGWPGIPFTPEVMVGHFAALPCPRRWRTSFRPHRLGVFLPPGTAVGCSLRARGSCPVQRCSQRPECNFKPLEQYGREPVCRRRAKGTRPWPTFPPRLSSGMFFLAVLPAAWVPGLGRARGGDGCGLPERGSVRLASARGGGRERQSGSRCRRHPAPRSRATGGSGGPKPCHLPPSRALGTLLLLPVLEPDFVGSFLRKCSGLGSSVPSDGALSARGRTARRSLGRRASPRRVRFGRAAASGWEGRRSALAASPSGRCRPQAETRRRGRPVLLPGSRPPRPRVPRSRTCPSGTVRPGVSVGGRLVGGACPPSTGTPLGSAPLGAGADIRTQRPGHARPQPSCVCVGPWT